MGKDCIFDQLQADSVSEHSGVDFGVCDVRVASASLYKLLLHVF